MLQFKHQQVHLPLEPFQFPLLLPSSRPDETYLDQGDDRADNDPRQHEEQQENFASHRIEGLHPPA